MAMKRGDIIECIKAPDYIDDLTLGKTYVVNDVKEHHGAEYVTILGDRMVGKQLLSSLFVKQR